MIQLNWSPKSPKKELQLYGLSGDFFIYYFRDSQGSRASRRSSELSFSLTEVLQLSLLHIVMYNCSVLVCVGHFRVSLYVFSYICISVFVSVFVCVFECVFVCVFAFSFKQLFTPTQPNKANLRKQRTMNWFSYFPFFAQRPQFQSETSATIVRIWKTRQWRKMMKW